MKRVLTIILVVLITLSLPMGVMAYDGSPKNSEVKLLSTATNVKVGETVTLTATTLKEGSSFTDEWACAVSTGTVKDPENDSYTSTATFTAEKPGTFTITYKIQMIAGKSDVLFTGTATKTIKVEGSATVIGVEIRNLTVTPLIDSYGKTNYYSMSGDIYVLWSDNTATLYGSTFFYFGNNETSRDINVTVDINGKQYIYTVTVTR